EATTTGARGNAGAAMDRSTALGLHVRLRAGRAADRVRAVRDRKFPEPGTRIDAGIYRDGALDSAARLGDRLLRLGLALRSRDALKRRAHCGDSAHDAGVGPAEPAACRGASSFKDVVVDGRTVRRDVLFGGLRDFSRWPTRRACSQPRTRGSSPEWAQAPGARW